MTGNSGVTQFGLRAGKPAQVGFRCTTWARLLAAALSSVTLGNMLAEALKRATLPSKQTLNLVELLMPGNPGQDLHDQWKPYLRNSDLGLSARLTEFHNDRDRIRPTARD